MDVKWSLSALVLLGSAWPLIATGSLDLGKIDAGCVVAGSSLESLGDNSKPHIIESTGDPLLDQQIGPLAFDLAKIFELDQDKPPGVLLVEDHPSAPVLKATDRSFLEGTDGTIFAGKSYLLSELHRHPHGGAAVAGLMAHEFAHVYQFRGHYWKELIEDDPQKRVRLAELHADFLAGWSMARAKYVTLEGINSFALSLFEKGDLRFESQQHHGTYAQRYAAMLRGYFLGRDPKVSLSDSAEIGANFVRGLV